MQYLPKELGQKACENSEDSDQMPQNVASDQGLHFLLLIHQLKDNSTGSKMDCSNLRTSMVRS